MVTSCGVGAHCRLDESALLQTKVNSHLQGQEADDCVSGKCSPAKLTDREKLDKEKPRASCVSFECRGTHEMRRKSNKMCGDVTCRHKECCKRKPRASCDMFQCRATHEMRKNSNRKCVADPCLHKECCKLKPTTPKPTTPKPTTVATTEEALPETTTEEPTQVEVEKNYVCNGESTAERELFSAYWDYESCGHFGDDYNANNLCGGIKGGNCPKFIYPKSGQEFITFDEVGAVKYPEISQSIKCRKAERVHYIKSHSYSTTGGADWNMAHAIKLEGCGECHYLWHAQYKCVDSA